MDIYLTQLRTLQSSWKNLGTKDIHGGLLSLTECHFTLLFKVQLGNNPERSEIEFIPTYTHPTLGYAGVYWGGGRKAAERSSRKLSAHSRKPWFTEEPASHMPTAWMTFSPASLDLDKDEACQSLFRLFTHILFQSAAEIKWVWTDILEIKLLLKDQSR